MTSFSFSQKFFLFILRVSAGWMFFYAGISAGRIFGLDSKRVHHHSGFKKWLG